MAELLGRTRAAGGLSHPGGTQWWLRDLGVERAEFDVYVWDDGSRIAGFALVDRAFYLVEALEDGPTTSEQLDWLEGQMRDVGRASLRTDVAEDGPTRSLLEARGYTQVGTALELIADTSSEPARATLPEGYRSASLLDVDDDAYIEGHRAAWSDDRPSPYRRELHDAVKAMPQFRADLVTIALAPDGTVAASCIGWLDERSQTLEIEPLGTHRDHRRLGLAHAVVKEVQHRAWANGARHVLVWNDPATNPAAYRLYTGADMPPRRTLVELEKGL